MADGTKIEWTDATWNPVTGCAIVSPGCTNCYAMKLAGTRLKHTPSRAGLTVESKAGPVWNGRVRFNEEWLDQPLRWKRPRSIFVCAHGDLFAENVPDEWIDRVFAVMALAPQHTFQVLTKRAARMRRYLTKSSHHFFTREGMIKSQSDFILARAGRLKERLNFSCALPLQNVWLGVSAEDQKRADERIPDLLATPAAIRFVSAEPLLGPIDFVNIDQHEKYVIDAIQGVWAWRAGDELEHGGAGARLDWVIVGGESGPGARPMHPAWARSIRDQCRTAAVPFFFKQWGAWKDGSDFAPDAMVMMTDGRLCEFGDAALLDMDREKPVPPCNPTLIRRVGKARSGRLLDGIEHNDFPKVAA